MERTRPVCLLPKTKAGTQFNITKFDMACTSIKNVYPTYVEFLARFFTTEIFPHRL